MVHLKSELVQHQQLLEKGIIIAPVAITKIAKSVGLKQAILDKSRTGTTSIVSSGYMIITDPPNSEAIIRVSFIGNPVPLAWKTFKDTLKVMGVSYVHPESDDKKLILDITNKTLIVS